MVCFSMKPKKDWMNKRKKAKFLNIKGPANLSPLDIDFFHLPSVSDIDVKKYLSNLQRVPIIEVEMDRLF